MAGIRAEKVNRPERLQIDRLEQHRMVYRRVGEEDRRRVIVGLTKAAENLLKSLSNQHIAELRQMAPDLIAAVQNVLGEL
jgi:DNA-binding MarR family transcriptional regulator